MKQVDALAAGFSMSKRGRLVKALALQGLAMIATLMFIDVVSRVMGVEHGVVEKLMEVVLLTLLVLPLAALVPLTRKS